MAISMIPTESDMSWIPSVTDVDYSDTNNTLLIGDYNRTEFIASGTNTSLTITSSKPNVWKFDCELYFGLINTTNPNITTQFYI